MKDPIEVRDRRDGGWFWVDKRVITGYGSILKPIAIAVYAALAIHTNTREECWPSMSRIAKLVGCSRSSVIRALDTLCTLGLIQRRTVRTLDGGFRTNQYLLLNVPDTPVMSSQTGVTGTPPSVTETPDLDITAQTGVTGTPPSVTGTPHVVSQGHTNKIHITSTSEREEGASSGPQEQDSLLHELRQKWEQVMTRLSAQIPPSAFTCWLEGARPVETDPPRVWVQVRDQLVVDYLSGSMKALVTRALCGVMGQPDLEPVFVSGNGTASTERF